MLIEKLSIAYVKLTEEWEKSDEMFDKCNELRIQLLKKTETLKCRRQQRKKIELVDIETEPNSTPTGPLYNSDDDCYVIEDEVVVIDLCDSDDETDPSHVDKGHGFLETLKE